MAAGDFVTSAKQKLREGDLGANRPNSEAVNQKLGGSINGLIDSLFYNVEANYQGYFSDSELFRLAPIRIQKISNIDYYAFSLRDTGSAGTNALNFQIKDNTGAVVGDLFGSGANQLTISGSSGTDVLIGRDVTNASTFATNIAGHTVQYGVLNYTTLQAGWMLIPKVESFGTSARSARLRLRIKEQ